MGRYGTLFARSLKFSGFILSNILPHIGMLVHLLLMSNGAADSQCLVPLYALWPPLPATAGCGRSPPPAVTRPSLCRRRQDFGDTDLYDDVVTADTGDGDSSKTAERSNGSAAGGKPDTATNFKPNNSRGGRRYQLYVGNLTWVSLSHRAF